ncbi:MAG: hypothetical protein ACQEXJ_01160 [Myxococcota bacterium]
MSRHALSKPTPRTGWSAALVRSLLQAPDGALAEAAGEDDTLSPTLLARASQHLARTVGGLAPVRRPLGGTLLRDLDGDPSAFVSVYSRDGSATTAAEVASGLEARSPALMAALQERRPADALRLASELTAPGSFTTVMVGARPTAPTLVSASSGLPPQVLTLAGRARVREASGQQTVTPVRTFYEPRMPPGYDIGILYEVSGAPGGTAVKIPSPGKGGRLPGQKQTKLPGTSTSTTGASGGARWIYLPPGPDHPMGSAIRAADYRKRQRRLRAATLRALAEPTVLAKPILKEAVKQSFAKKPVAKKLLAPVKQYRAARSKQARQWGRLAATVGYTTARAACPSCSEQLSSELRIGLVDALDTHFGGIVDAGACDRCALRYEDGSEVSVSTCEGAGEKCCDVVDGEWAGDNCVVDCHCAGCEETRTETERIGRLLRGVPALDQFEIDDPKCESGPVAVGCTPVAMAELILWHAALGFGVANDFRTWDGYDWQSLVLDFRDRMNSKCDDADGTTGTWLFRQRPGLVSYFRDVGWKGLPRSEFDVEKRRVRDSDEREAWVDIQVEVDAFRPVVINYCAGSKCPDADGLGEVNHTGLVTGWQSTDAGRFVYIVTGWGVGKNAIRQWYIPDGFIHLVFTDVDPDEDVDDNEAGRRCPSDDIDDFLADHGPTGWSAEEARYDSEPVLEDIVGDDCDLLEDVETSDVTYRWDERVRCVTPEDYEKLDRHLEESHDSLGEDPCWEDPLDTDCGGEGGVQP